MQRVGQDVQRNLETVGYPAELVHYVPGTVEETIPATPPGEVTLLRRDTGCYASTRHEPEQFYPLVARGGIVLVADFGAWEGARKAVDHSWRPSRRWRFFAST